MSYKSFCSASSRRAALQLARRVAGSGALAALAGCSGPQVEQYAAQRPPLDLQRYFSGHTQAWGMFQQRGGEVVKRFHVDIEGSSATDALVLKEDFLYSDGTRQQRTWTLHRSADGLWHGTAGDVVGESLGQAGGNAFHMSYVLRVPIGSSTWDMDMDDWMYLIDERTLVNRTRMSKFGIELGQVTLFFRPGE
jgi:hypothetical protein